MIWGFPKAAAAPYGGTVTNEALKNYFKAETEHLRRVCLDPISSLEQWNQKREQFRRELFEMFGLWPIPERTDLKAQVTGKFEEGDIIVENIHFQSRPGLYVTANLYRPKNLSAPAPTILYLSGHGPVITNGISYGNKVAYQHHGIWFARHGYVCMVLDTLQLGEIQGIHHGTYREGMWWWNSRGYTSGGVEAWNSIRALDYLSTRSEVDANRFGATGRSGGGAYSWSLAALDERIKVVAPVAGITDLENYVVDGAVEGHCDCMFFVNTFRWDYPQMAALVAPRALLIANTDKDTIFPLDGVVRLHSKVRDIYRLHKAEDKLGLLITEGPHKDTQDLQLPVLRWFNRFLKKEDPLIEKAAVRLFSPQQLKVFEKLPEDQINTKIHDSFVLQAKPELPTSAQAWASQKKGWQENLRTRVFAGWPEQASPSLSVIENKPRGKIVVSRQGLKTQEHVNLELISVATDRKETPIILEILDGPGWQALKNSLENDASLQARLGNETLFFFAPRGVVDEPPDPKAKDFIQQRRRYMLLGQTLDSMRVWDIRQAIQAVQKSARGKSIQLRARGSMAVNTLYAALGHEGVKSLELTGLPLSQRDGPDYLNVLRFLDLPQVVAMVAEEVPVVLLKAQPDDWTKATATLKVVGKEKRLVFQNHPSDGVLP